MISFEFELDSRATVQLQVFGADGKLAFSHYMNNEDKGNKLINWDASGLPAGIYFYHLCVITNEGKKVVKGKIVKTGN